jgi:hypothetical protein
MVVAMEDSVGCGEGEEAYEKGVVAVVQNLQGTAGKNVLWRCRRRWREVNLVFGGITHKS